MARPSTGSVFFEGGRWKARLTMPDGRRKIFALPAWYTEEQATAKAAEMAHAVKVRGVEAIEAVEVQAGETTDAYFDRFFAWRESKGQTDVKNSRGRYKNWVSPILGWLEVRMVKAPDLERVVRHLDQSVRRGELAWATAGNVWGEVTSGFNQAFKSKHLALRVRTDNPTRDVLGPDGGIEKDKPILFPDEVVTLLACERVPLYRRRVYAVAAYTGAREGELRALSAASLDVTHGRMTIATQIDRKTREERQTKTKRARSFDIEPALLPLLRVLAAERPDRLLHLPPKEDSAELLRQDLRVAGITRAALFVEDDPSRLRMRFHGLRDTCLTWMAVRGDDALKVQWRAGHTDLKMTTAYVAAGRNLGAAAFVVPPFPPLPRAVLVRVSAGVSAGFRGKGRGSPWIPGLSIATPTGIEGVNRCDETAKQAVLCVERSAMETSEDVSPRVSAGASTASSPTSLGPLVADLGACLARALEASDFALVRRLRSALDALLDGADTPPACVVDLDAERARRGS